MEIHYETYDGTESMSLARPYVQGINVNCAAGKLTKVHLDLVLPSLKQTGDMEIIPQLLKQIENIEIERPE